MRRLILGRMDSADLTYRLPPVLHALRVRRRAEVATTTMNRGGVKRPWNETSPEEWDVLSDHVEVFRRNRAVCKRP